MTEGLDSRSRAPQPAISAAATEADAHAPVVLRSSVFRRGREEGWRELEGLVARVERSGLGALDVTELQRLPLLYRSALSGLSVARAIALDRNLLLYLETLALRAFLVVYGPRESVLRGIGAFLARDFPSAVRGALGPIVLAFLAIALGVAAGYWLVVQDTSWLSTLVPSWLSDDRGEKSTRQSLLADEIFAPWPGFARSFVVFASFLFQHNTLVGLLTFGLGVAAGVPSFLLLVYQGLIFGAFLALHAQRDLTTDFLGWVSIHGVTEFGAIILCGAGALIVARAALLPGGHRRIDMIAARGREAARLVVGAVLLFFVAGLIEGGLRQLVASTPARFWIAGATAVAWLAYFTLAGRRSAGSVRP